MAQHTPQEIHEEFAFAVKSESDRTDKIRMGLQLCNALLQRVQQLEMVLRENNITVPPPIGAPSPVNILPGPGSQK